MPQQTAHKKAILSETPVSVGSPEVGFDPKQFDDFIYAHGYAALIERRIYCPCVSVPTGMWQPNCLNCGGTGKVYINKTSTVIGCTSMSNRNKYESWSAVNMGTVNITARPTDKMGFEDRITLTELEMYFSEVVVLRLSDDGEEMFAFTHYFADQILEAYYYINSNTPLKNIDPHLIRIRDNKITFRYAALRKCCGDVGADFTISLLYNTHPQYMIIDVNRDMVKNLTATDCNTGVPSRRDLPLNYVGKLVHILADQPNRSGQSLFDNTNYSGQIINNGNFSPGINPVQGGDFNNDFNNDFSK